MQNYCIGFVCYDYCPTSRTCVIVMFFFSSGVENGRQITDTASIEPIIHGRIQAMYCCVHGTAIAAATTTTITG